MRYITIHNNFQTLLPRLTTPKIMHTLLTFTLRHLLLLTLIIFNLTTTAHASLPQAANVPGGVALIKLGRVQGPYNKPLVWFNEKAVLVTTKHQHWVAVVGLPLDLKPGSHLVKVQNSGTTKELKFKVKAKKYPEQHITLTDTGKVELNPENEARAVREIATIKQLKLHWSESKNTDLALKLPAEGRLSGNFGLRRFFNGQPRSPHAGLDVAVASGTPILSSSGGTVLAVDDYFFNGKTIFVDHGNGLLTMYCHLDQSDVQTGDPVSKGQQLGLSGMSGRATGPHLHWSVILNGALVDPALFIQTKKSHK
jgi:murein DD-endopeptidase MepM/ murein hydrolase activator NlpD